MTMLSAKYVSYYDCSSWNSDIEVMNIQAKETDYHITIFDRDGSEIWADTRTLTSYQTERLKLDTIVKNQEGMVMIEPTVEGEEFPALLTIADEGRHWKQATRFVSFTRIPYDFQQVQPIIRG